MAEADNFDDLEKDIENAERILDDKKEEVVDDKKPVETDKPVETEDVVVDEKEDEDHKLKSHIGRIVARQVKEATSPLLNAINEINSKLTVKPDKEEELEDLPEDATVADVRKYIEKREARLLAKLEQKETEKVTSSVKKRETYAEQYNSLLSDMVDPDEDKELYELLTARSSLPGGATEFNRVHSNFEDAKQDFLLNYRAASKALMNKNKGVKKTVADKKTGIPSGVNTPGAIVRTKPVDTSKWSAEERDLASHFSEEELADILGT